MTQSNDAPDYDPAETEQQAPPAESGGDAGINDVGYSEESGSFEETDSDSADPNAEADVDSGADGGADESGGAPPLSEADQATSDGEGGLTIQGITVIDATAVDVEPVESEEVTDQT